MTVPIMDAAERVISRKIVSFSEQKKFHTVSAKLPLVVVKRVLPVIHGCLLCETFLVKNRNKEQARKTGSLLSISCRKN